MKEAPQSGQDATDEGMKAQNSLEEGESSVSTISDSITRPSVDGNDFLRHLRAAGAFDTELRNEESFGFSQKRNERQDLATLSELFHLDAPGRSNPDSTLTLALQQASNEDTIGRSNKTSNSQKNPPNLTSLATLFEAPTAASTKPAPAPATAPGLISSKAASVAPLPTRATSPVLLSPKSVLKQTVPSSGFSTPGPPPKSGPKQTIPSPDVSTLSPQSENDSLLRNSDNSAPAGLPPRPQPARHHSRSVSWGNNTTFPAPSPANQYPSFRTEEPNPRVLQAIPSQSSFDSVSSLGNDHRRTNTRTQFNLEDFLGSNVPYEQEAESSIIRALELQQAAKGHQRSRTEASTSLLGQVSESAVHDFTLEPEETATSSCTTPLSPAQSKDGSEKAKLLSSHHRKKVPGHRRHLSVEQTLAGLTHAMAAVHGSPAKTRYGLADSSASAFANNASRLSEQQKQQELPNHIRKNTRIWQIDNLPMVEEHHARGSGGASDDYNHTSDDDDTSDIESPTFAEDDNAAAMDGQDNVETTATTRKRQRRQTIIEEAGDQLKTEWEVWGAFFRPRKEHVKTYIRNVLAYLILPATAIAFLLFYACGNPRTGTGNTPSVSWWLLFAVREVVTFSMALAMQGLFIDFLSLGTKFMLRLVGPVLTLLIVQSKGWPFICFWWGIFDFAMLASGGQFAHHWLYWQNAVGLFNAENPSGNVASSPLHRTILTVAVCVSVIVGVKRFLIGLYLGRQTFTHYGDKLAKLLNNMLLVSEVASLAKDIEKSRIPEKKTMPVSSEAFGGEGDRLYGFQFSDDGTATSNAMDSSDKFTVIDTAGRDPLTGNLTAQAKSRLMQLLGQWEEPIQGDDPRQDEVANISAVLRFRKALTFIQKAYPFSYAFGPADVRENCIESAQKVYNRLLLHTPGKQVLGFETLALLALEGEGDSVDQEKAKDLVKLFRPDREGRLTMLDFIKSIDSVYREFRMLNAAIHNSSQIDRAFENIFNVVFYIALVTVILSVLGFNPMALFLSFSSVILGFAFMIGSASSKYFEGVLFILVRRPYNIGDVIHISPVEQDTNIEGSAGWIVEHVTLYETIATWIPTKERCSLSNGSLSSSRIINAARSPQAQFHVFLKFPIDTPYDRILVFKTAIEEYMKARPREWLALNGFRAHRIVADQGYVEYDIVIQHRESWQNVGQVLDSKANFSSFCNEVSKQLNMHYRAPPLPVHIRYMNGADIIHSAVNQGADSMPHGGVPSDIGQTVGQTEADPEAQVKEFRQIALNNHNIRLH